jgi:hypothetical protein
MRKFILVAAMVLVSATAHAGASLASSDRVAAVGQQSGAGEAGQSAARQRPSMRYQSRMRMRQQGGFAGRHGHRPRFGLFRGKGRGLLARIKYAFHRRFH